MQNSRTLVDVTCDVCGKNKTIQDEYKQIRGQAPATVVSSPLDWYLIEGLDICEDHGQMTLKELVEVLEKH